MAPRSAVRAVALATLLAALPDPGAAQAAPPVRRGADVRVSYRDDSGAAKVLTGVVARFGPDALVVHRHRMFGTSREEIPRDALTRLRVCDGCSRARDYLLGGAGFIAGVAVGSQLFQPRKSDEFVWVSDQDVAALLAILLIGVVGRQVGLHISSGLGDWTDVPLDVAIGSGGRPDELRVELRLR